MPDPLRGFVGELLGLWDGLGFYDIGADDIENLLVKHGLAKTVAATAEDCATALGREYYVEVGDPWLQRSPLLNEIVEEWRR
jgi:hypothetical protein